MPARKCPQGIQAHPMMGAITEAILKGETLTSIRTWADPRPSIAALSHFKVHKLAPAMRLAERSKTVLPDNVKRSAGISPRQQPVSLTNQPDVARQTDQRAIEDAQPAQIVKFAITSAPLIAIREKRIDELEDRRRRMRMIIDERAVEMAGETAGGASGLLCRDYKGKDADRAIYKVDTGLLSELREHEKQAAQELGQWQEGTGTQIAIQIVVPAADGHQIDPRQAEATIIDITPR
jgi:hypothetical protein